MIIKAQAPAIIAILITNITFCAVKKDELLD